jgi:hypothetical protein
MIIECVIDTFNEYNVISVVEYEDVLYFPTPTHWTNDFKDENNNIYDVFLVNTDKLNNFDRDYGHILKSVKKSAAYKNFIREQKLKRITGE